MNCSKKIPEMGKLFIECENNFNQPSFCFIGNSCYRGFKYFGDIIYKNDSLIKVKCKNGNRYMEGQIIEFKINEII